MTAAPSNYRFEDDPAGMTWANARTRLPLELHIDTVSLLPRTQARENLLHGVPTRELPTIQHVTFDGTPYAHCWQELSLGGRNCEAILPSSRPIDLDAPWRNAPSPPAPPEDFDVMHRHGPSCRQIPTNFDSDSDEPDPPFAPLSHGYPAGH